MKLIRFLYNLIKTESEVTSEHGFTLLELLVASSLGLIVTLICTNTTAIQKQLFKDDSIRISLNQELRGAANIIVSDGRMAGEKLSATFPAILLGTRDDKQELTIRRNLLDETLNVCESIKKGAAKSYIIVANSNETPGCIVENETSKFEKWREYRQSQEDGKVLAFIYNSNTKTGEFFTYVAESSSTGTYRLTLSSQDKWSQNYPAKTSWLLILEEWRYSTNDNMLQIVENGDERQPFNVAYGINNFNVEITLKNGTVKNSFTTEDDWTEIKKIKVNLGAEDLAGSNRVTKNITTAFFPRNVLSH